MRAPAENEFILTGKSNNLGQMQGFIDEMKSYRLVHIE